MTITSTQNRVSYAGNGAPGVPGTLAFSVPFRFLAISDLVVLVRVDATGADTTKTLDTHYSVSGEGAATGGTVTFLIEDGEPQTGETLIIYGNPAMTQLVDYIAGGVFPAESHEEALDRLTLQSKRSRELVERTPRLMEGDTDGSGQYDANSNRISNLGTPTATTDAATKTYTDVLVNNTALGPAPTGLIATGSVTSRLLADRWGEVKNVKDFGAVGDGVTDDTAAFLAAETASNFVRVTAGTYRIATNLSFDATLVGDGGVLFFENCTVSFNKKIQSAPNVLFTFGSSVLFSITEPQDVYADWFLQSGSEEFAIQRAFEFSAAGSRILLLGKTYTTKAITWNNDPLDATGKDTGKVIEGVSTAQRYNTTGEFFGTRIVLADNENTNMFTVDSDGANTFGSGAIRNVMLQGNKSNQTAGSGIEIQAVKDFLIENVYIWDFQDDGLNLTGANNQINIEGYLECWNNTRDGIRGAAVGDAQMNGTIRCVNNGRYGFYLAAGSGRYDQIYSYFNGDRGVWISSAVSSHLHINYLRSEDNDKEGCRIDAQNVSIDYCEVPDNGVTGSTGIENSGLYLSSTAANVNIRTLSAANRSAAVHLQTRLLYDTSLKGCSVENILNNAYGQHGIAVENTVYFANNTSLAGCFVNRRMTVSDTYANLKDVAATISPQPDTYGRYNVTDITESMTILNTTASLSCEGMFIEFAVESNGSYNLNFGAEYLDASGSAIPATALTSSQTAFSRFQQTNGKWYLISPIVVA